MPKLVSVSDVVLRGSLPEIQDVKAKVSASIDAATVYLAEVLRTDFDLETRVDQFYVDPINHPFTGDFIKIMSTKGFIDTLSVLELRYAFELDNVAGETPIEDRFIKVTALKGLILILALRENYPPLNASYRRNIYSDQSTFFIELNYTAGFTTGNSEFGSVYQNVPSWLSEAAILISLRLFNETAGCDAKNNKAPLNIHAMLERYIRFEPSALSALI